MIIVDYTTEQVAQMYKCQPSWVRELIARGDFPNARKGKTATGETRKWLIPESDIDPNLLKQYKENKEE